ncbi:MAG TPA: NADH-quinone oxidoreductase subunit NuoF [Candidatus Binataceae bacterium]|jgi:NADH-quinone oxidoreductase subunit F|nr:NADH-quinone oxidoreductase subunit NuoF [Candidatus Binataceae bacterium]
MERILTRWLDIPNLGDLDVYLAHDGYTAARKAFFDMKPEEIIDEVKNSNLRGRGGAAFPTGVKWSFIPKNSPKPVYVCCNADESEPGTFANRYQLENDPHGIIEGILIACRAVGAHTCYIYLRGEFTLQMQILDAALAQARAKGYVGADVMGSGFGVEIYTHRGAGAYICGEETGLLESLEGKRGYPRNRPPFPAIAGAFGCPTVVNNVETLSNVPWIIKRGAKWFTSIGPEKSPGPKLFCLSGHVNKPGLYELPMGFPLKDLIYEVGGGILNDRKLKGVIPGGASFPVFTAEEAVKVNMDFDSVRAAGSLMGTAGVMVMNQDTCMVGALLIIAHFFHHESCGQCTPCREGTGWIEKMLIELEAGRGSMADLDRLISVASNMEGNTICVLADSLSMPVKSFVPKYKDEFIEHVKQKRCPFRAQEAATLRAAS